VTKDKRISKRISAQQLNRAFSLKRQLRNVDKIFERVFGESKSKPTAKGRR